MAVIGRGFAILDSRFTTMSGLPAWLAWAFVHLLFLPAAGNRIRVWTQAMWCFLTHQRSSQLILEPRCIQKLLAIEGKMLHELKEEIANEQPHNSFTN